MPGIQARRPTVERPTLSPDIMGNFSTLKFLQDQFWKVEPAVRADLTGKTVVVVGANVGLGFEVAKHFASMNPKRLVLGCRNQAKGQAAVEGKSLQPCDSNSGRLSLSLTDFVFLLSSHPSLGGVPTCRACTRRPLPICFCCGICRCVRSRGFTNRYPRL